MQLFIERTLTIGVGLLGSIVTLGSFVIILWSLSAAAPLQMFGTTFNIPGYLVWAALVICRYGLAHGVAGTALGSYEAWSGE